MNLATGAGRRLLRHRQHREGQGEPGRHHRPRRHREALQTGQHRERPPQGQAGRGHRQLLRMGGWVRMHKAMNLWAIPTVQGGPTGFTPEIEIYCMMVEIYLSI